MSKRITKHDVEKKRGPGCYEVNEESQLKRKDKVVSYRVDNSKRVDPYLKD